MIIHILNKYQCFQGKLLLLFFVSGYHVFLRKADRNMIFKNQYFLEIFIFSHPYHFMLVCYIWTFQVIDGYFYVSFHLFIFVNKRHVILCKVNKKAIFEIDTFLKNLFSLSVDIFSSLIILC